MSGTILVVGAGTMGFEMIKAFVRAGYSVLVCDVDVVKVNRAAAAGALPVKSPREGAAIADFSLLSLGTPEVIKAVVTGSDGVIAGARQGHIIIDTSTVDPQSTRLNAALARESAVGYLDAPVLGRPQSCGKWTIPVGGDEGDFKKIENILKVIAAKVVYVGPSGNADTIKLLNNMMLGVTNMITVEILAVAARLGIDPALVYETIAKSGAASVSNMFIELGPKVLKRDFTPVFTIDFMFKDMDLGIQMSQNAGATPVVTLAAQKFNELAREKGLGGEDTGAIIKIYEDLFSPPWR
jgi:3-hydroxyisobutyrate dehydrogenase-like beta-hydroxyacid dehydrogenase